MVNASIAGAADCAGIVCELLGGTVSNCSVTGTVASASPETGGAAGGIVATNKGGIVENCATDAYVMGIRGVGGIVGYNLNGENGEQGIIRGCHAIGNVFGEQYHVGGLVGSNLATIENCYATGEVRKKAYSYNIVRDVGGFAGVNGAGEYREIDLYPNAGG